MKKVLFAVLPMALLVSGCGNGYYQAPNGQLMRSVPCGDGTNTAVGLGAGAIAGGLIGNSAGGRRGRFGRTLLGAGAGALAGGLIGSATERRCAVPVNQGYDGAYPGYGGGYSGYGYSGQNVTVTRPVTAMPYNYGTPVYAVPPSPQYAPSYGYEGDGGYSGRYYGNSARYVD